MIAAFWLLVVLGLGHCQDNDLPSSAEVESSINRTIEEVERMVRDNPSLPQLTRQEIVNILLNITAKEVNSYRDKDKVEKARRLYQKALMVVLPYNADDSNGDLNDLYTKPPMTQIVPDILNSGRIETEEVNSGRDKTMSVATRVPDVDTTSSSTTMSKTVSLATTVPELDTTFSSTTMSRTVSLATRVPEVDTTSSSTSTTTSRAGFRAGSREPATTLRNRYKNHRETYSEVQTKAPLKETIKLDTAPVRFTFNLENLQRGPYTTDRTTTTRRPVYRKDTTDQKVEIVYSTSLTTESTTPGSIDPTEPPETESSSNQNVLSSDQWRYNPPPASTLRPMVDRYRDKARFTPTTIRIMAEDAVGKTGQVSTTETNLIAESAEMAGQENSAPLYVTPMAETTSQKTRYSSTYTLNSGGFRTAPTSTGSPMRPEVMDLLASIGLRPENGSNVEDVYKNQKILEKVRVPGTNNLVRTTTSGLTDVGSDLSSIAGQNTFESSGSEIKKGVQNLTPDVQLLFQRFGLQTSNLGSPTSTSTQRTTVNSYTNFKPLPTSSVKDLEMKEFLAKFGLGGSEGKRQRAMQMTTRRPSLLDAVPGNMRNILENIGLITKRPKQRREDMESTETTRTQLHVSKPHETGVKTEEQRRKINELLDKVRMAQEGKGSVEEVQKAAKELLNQAKTLQEGPDPLSLEEIIRLYTDERKNEVKRQQQDTTTTTSTTTTTTTTTTMEDEEAGRSGGSSNPTEPSPGVASTTEVTSTTTTNLTALEESFGGTTSEPDPVIPASRKSGLYFLVDWNTFLEVGEEDGEKINLRFQPKAGDRSRFLPVNVP